MLIMSYIRSSAIDEEDMTTHISPPGMVMSVFNLIPCHPVVCCYSILGSSLAYLWVEYGTVFTTPKLSRLVPSCHILPTTRLTKSGYDLGLMS